jgi:Flp pilus assembly protein TadD
LLIGGTDESGGLKEITSNYGDLGSVQYLMALSLIRQGKTEAATQALKTAVKLSPREADFLVLMNEVGRKSGSK